MPRSAPPFLVSASTIFADQKCPFSNECWQARHMQDFRALYRLLARNIECGVWWPADSRFEIIVGAVLTQNTNWGNVEKAIHNLRRTRLLDPEAILACPREELAELIRPAGYFNAKSTYLQAVSAWFLDSDRHAHGWETDTLRQRLMQVRGVGSETADDILLYAYDRPVFIYDLYARRLLEAAKFGTFRTYDQAKNALDCQVKAAKFTASELAHFHGLIVDGGKIARSLGGWGLAYPRLLSGDFGATAGG